VLRHVKENRFAGMIERDDMNFTEIAAARQSCRKYDTERTIEAEKLQAVLDAARMAPSACNSQPYRMTVCRGSVVEQIAKAKTAACEGINDFVAQADTVIVISEQPVVVSPSMVERMKDQNFRDIDIGILAAYITAEATAQGLGSCIVGLFDDVQIRALCHLDAPVRLLITLGYPCADVVLREKRRKSMDDLVERVEDEEGKEKTNE
jgi:nitroreductase